MDPSGILRVKMTHSRLPFFCIIIKLFLKTSKVYKKVNFSSFHSRHTMWRTPVAVELRLFFSFNSLFWLRMTTENWWTILHFVSLFTTKSKFNQDCEVEIAGSVACFRKESERSLFLYMLESESFFQMY